MVRPGGAWYALAARRHPLLIAVTALYIAGWTVYAITAQIAVAYPNLVWTGLVLGLMMYLDRAVRFSTHVLAMLSIAGFCHMAGASLYISGTLLYRQTWLEFIRYDHLVHVVGLGTAGLVVWEATRRMLATPGGVRAAVVVVLGSNAIGAVVEIGEYLATLTLPVTRVGAYANNMQDLIANLVGSLVAAWWASRCPVEEPDAQPRPDGRRSGRLNGDLAT